VSQGAEPRILVTIVEDKPGVLYKVSSIIRRRSINIDAIAVAPTTQPGVSKMTFLVSTDERTMELLVKQIERVPTVISVGASSLKRLYSKELALIKVSASKPSEREMVCALASKYGARVVEERALTLTMEIVGEPEVVNNFISEVKAIAEVVDLARSGPVALSR
jgi:acetolactate synthase-1/3 small subunit